MSMVCKTENLLLREFSASDAAFTLQLLNSKGWLDYIGNKGVHTIEDAKTYLTSGPISNYKKLGFGLYLVELNDNNTPIGMCGLLKREALPNVDIGFAFLPEYMKKGYAREAVKAILDHIHKNLKIKIVLAITQENNQRCIKLLNALGFAYQKNVKLSNDEQELLLYSIELR